MNNINSHEHIDNTVQSPTTDNNSELINTLGLSSEIIHFIADKQKALTKSGKIHEAKQLGELLGTGLVLDMKTKNEIATTRLNQLSEPYRSVKSVLNFIEALGIDITKEPETLKKAINTVFYNSKNNGLDEFMSYLHRKEMAAVLSINATEATHLPKFTEKSGKSEILPEQGQITIAIGGWGTGRGWYMVEEKDIRLSYIIKIGKEYL